MNAAGQLGRIPPDSKIDIHVLPTFHMEWWHLQPAPLCQIQATNRPHHGHMLAKKESDKPEEPELWAIV